MQISSIQQTEWVHKDSYALVYEDRTCSYPIDISLCRIYLNKLNNWRIKKTLQSVQDRLSMLYFVKLPVTFECNGPSLNAYSPDSIFQFSLSSAFIQMTAKSYKLYNQIEQFSMCPALEIANFRIQQPAKSVQNVIKDLIFMRKHKQISVQKPVLDFYANDKSWYDADNNKNICNYFITQEQELEQKGRTDKILLQKAYKEKDQYQISNQSRSNMRQNGEVPPNKFSQVVNQNHQTACALPFRIMKRRLIKKAISQSVDKQKQKELQKTYSKYLLNYLHKSNMLLIHRNTPPNLSVLETIDDGDYLDQGQKKDFPHFSNVLQPIELPPVMKQQVRIIRQPVRLDPRQHVFSIQDNTVFKVKHIYLLLQKIFEESMRICQKIRQMNFNGDYSLRIQNQNHQFQKIGQMIGLNFKTCKLLYDMLNDHYDIQKELAIGKSDDSKLKTCKELALLAQKQIKKYFDTKLSVGQSILFSNYIPLSEYYVSLKDLRDIFIQVYQNDK